MAVRVCGEPGCPVVVEAGSYCVAHVRPSQWKGMGADHKRGWSKARHRQLRDVPWCEGCGDPAVEVDHVVPRSRGGGNDPENLQSLCRRCHNAKSLRERHAARRG